MATNPLDLINQLFTFAIVAGGLIAFGEIVYGGFQYAISAGNSSTQSDAKDRIWQAIIGLFLLFGAYLILVTINPGIVTAELPPLAPIEPPEEAAPGTEEECNDLHALAAKYNITYLIATSSRPQIDPVMGQLITCIRNHDNVRKKVNLRESFTVDVSHPTCNYTRGAPQCEYPCSHTTLSCHYGGPDGEEGALAVDFSVGQDIVTQEEYDAVRSAVKSCGKGTAKMNPFGYPGHIGHMHISAGKCNGDNGWIVK